MRRVSVLLVAVMALLLVLPVAAVAGPPSAVTIEVEEFISGPGAVISPGPLCAGGTTEDLNWKKSPDHPWGFNLKVVKRFTCGDGTFDVRLRVRVFSNPSPLSSIFRWKVVGGDGAYATLRGSGSGVGWPGPGLPNYEVLDIYSGKVRY